MRLQEAEFAAAWLRRHRLDPCALRPVAFRAFGIRCRVAWATVRPIAPARAMARSLSAIVRAWRREGVHEDWRRIDVSCDLASGRSKRR
jgi:hypothetical protein